MTDGINDGLENHHNVGVRMSDDKVRDARIRLQSALFEFVDNGVHASVVVKQIEELVAALRSAPVEPAAQGRTSRNRQPESELEATQPAKPSTPVKTRNETAALEAELAKKLEEERTSLLRIQGLKRLLIAVWTIAGLLTIVYLVLRWLQP
jgi:hypothetical protein